MKQTGTKKSTVALLLAAALMLCQVPAYAEENSEAIPEEITNHGEEIPTQPPPQRENPSQKQILYLYPNPNPNPNLNRTPVIILLGARIPPPSS